MTYLSDRTRKRKLFFHRSLFLVCVLCITIFWTSIRGGAHGAAEPLVYGYVYVKKFFSVTPEFIRTYVSSRQSLEEQKKSLEETVRRLENELAEKNSALEEFTLGQNFSEDINETHPTLVVYPLLEDSTKLYSTILLSRGFKDGVEVGDYVYVAGLRPVCIIQEVYTKTSLCLLLTASGNAVDAVLKTASSSLTVPLIGRGGGIFLGEVPKDTVIEKDTPVYLKSNPSMQIGVVSSIFRNDQDTSGKVFITGMYNPLTSNVLYLRK